MHSINDKINIARENPDYLDELLRPAGKYLSEIDLSRLRIDTIPCGFGSLDDYLFLKKDRSELIIIGGRPSMGKSAFMFQIAKQVSKTVPVHVFSLEMDEEQIVTRLVSGMINRPVTAIQRGLISDKELIPAKEELNKLQYIVDDRAGINVHQLCDAAKEWHAQVKTGLIVIDYLQLLRTEKGHSKDDEIGNITKSLKALAKELKVPVIVGSQLNRDCERRGTQTGNYKPMLSDLRESGNIEQDADIVLAVHRESRYTNERPGEADILILKNRNGPVGDILMTYIDNQTLFIDNKGSI